MLQEDGRDAHQPVQVTDGIAPEDRGPSNPAQNTVPAARIVWEMPGDVPAAIPALGAISCRWLHSAMLHRGENRSNELHAARSPTPASSWPQLSADSAGFFQGFPTLEISTKPLGENETAKVGDDLNNGLGEKGKRVGPDLVGGSGHHITLSSRRPGRASHDCHTGSTRGIGGPRGPGCFDEI